MSTAPQKFLELATSDTAAIRSDSLTRGQATGSTRRTFM